MTDQQQAPASTDIPRSRALALLTPRAAEGGDERPASGFLAQLIACDLRLPAYRSARMAEPSLAASAYEGQLGLRPARLDCSV